VAVISVPDHRGRHRQRCACLSSSARPLGGVKVALAGLCAATSSGTTIVALAATLGAIARLYTCMSPRSRHAVAGHVPSPPSAALLSCSHVLPVSRLGLARSCRLGLGRTSPAPSPRRPVGHTHRHPASAPIWSRQPPQHAARVGATVFDAGHGPHTARPDLPHDVRHIVATQPPSWPAASGPRAARGRIRALSADMEQLVGRLAFPSLITPAPCQSPMPLPRLGRGRTDMPCHATRSPASTCMRERAAVHLYTQNIP
jgi:hypothetical protein